MVAAAVRYRFPCFAIIPPAGQLHDVEAEAARRALDGPHRRPAVGRRQVGHLRARDLLDLRPRHGPDLRLPRLLGALLETGGALQEHGRRRRLGDERERPVGVHGDHDRDDQSRLGLRLGVERLAELHDVHATLTERRSDGRTRIRLSGRNLQLDLRDDLLRHAPYAFSTCTKSSSTGVARPKMLISTRSLPLSGFTSSTTPLKSWNGPSMTFTCSPCSKRTLGFGLTAPSSIWCVISRTSASEMGGMESGSVAPPRNPVTLGVDLTMCQVSLFRRMLTRM